MQINLIDDSGQRRRIEVHIETGNAAFQDGNLGRERARIILAIARRIRRGETSGKCMDVNGNSVGKWELLEGVALYPSSSLQKGGA